MLHDLEKVSKKVTLMYDPEYKWTGMVAHKDRNIPVFNTQKETPEKVLSALWNWIDKHKGF